MTYRRAKITDRSTSHWRLQVLMQSMVSNGFWMQCPKVKLPEPKKCGLEVPTLYSNIAQTAGICAACDAHPGSARLNARRHCGLRHAACNLQCHDLQELVSHIGYNKIEVTYETTDTCVGIDWEDFRVRQYCTLLAHGPPALHGPTTWIFSTLSVAPAAGHDGAADER